MSFEKKNNINSDEINIRELVSKYLIYWKWLLISMFVFVGIASIYLAITNNQYEISTSVLIKDEESGVSELAILDDLGFNGGKNNIDNEIQIFKSADLIKSTINATKYNIICTKKQGLKDAIIYPNPFDILIKDINLDTITAPISIYITKEKNFYHFNISYKEKTLEIKKKHLPVELKLTDGTIQIENLAPISEIEDGYLIQIFNPESMAVEISNKINVTPTSKNSSVLTISYITQNIKEGKDFLNKYVELYNEQAVEDKNQIAFNTAMFIDDRLKSLTVELSTVEKNVEDFKTKHKITDISSETELFINQTGINEEKAKEIETQLNIIKYVESFINDENNKNRLIPILGITDQSLAELINKYNQLLLEKDRIERASTSANPILESMINQLSSMRYGIKHSIVNIRKTLSIAKTDIDFENAQTSGKIRQIPKIERELIEIKRQQQIKETLYVFLLQKREETNLTLAATTPKAKTVSTARANYIPVAPRKKITLLISLIFGLAFPIAIIYIVDLFKTEISSREELEKLSRVPIIGEIPINQTDKKIIVSPTDTSSGTELFRLLRNNLLFILKSDTEPKKIITVTSTVSGEGKSFICVNLACTFALTDNKVLIIGLDIRNPSIGKYLGINERHGITSYLAMGEDLESLITTSTQYPNLDILPTGIIPPNPNELLNKPNLDKAIEELKEKYDYIIIDTAPVGVISDTFLINRVSDLTLYITREKVTNKDSILLINDLHEEGRLTKPYLVLNGSKIGKKHRGYRTGYYYEYYKRNEQKKSKFKQLFSSLK